MTPLTNQKKSRSIPVTNLFHESTKIEKPSEINFYRDNKYVSYLFKQGESLASIT